MMPDIIGNLLRRGDAEAPIRRDGGFTLDHAAFLLVAAHLVFLLLFFAPAIATPDANSYFSQARTLATQGRTYAVKESPVQYVGPHYGESRDGGRYYCSHSPGLGVILAVVYRLLGAGATFAVNPLLAALSLLGFFFLCRSWFGRRWALLALALMAVNPVLNEHALFGDAHVAAAALLVWALVLLNGLARRPSLWLGLGAGVLAGMIPCVRYAEAAYIPALAWFALSRRRQDGADRTALWAAAAGACAPLLLLCVRNQSAYGAFWRTGYAAPAEQALFAASYFFRNSGAFVDKLLSQGGGLTFALGLVAIALMCGRRAARRRGVLLAGIAAPTTVLYMSYYWPPDPQSMRFLLPTFFLYAAAAAWLMRLLARQPGPRARAAVAALLIVHAWWGLPRSVRAMAMLRHQTLPLAGMAGVLRRAVPAGSVLIAPEGVNQFLDVFEDWRLADSSLVSAPGPRRPVPRSDPYAGLAGARRLGAFTSDVWTWAGRDRVFWLLTPSELEEVRRRAPGGELRGVADFFPGSGPMAGPLRGIPDLPGASGPGRPFGPGFDEPGPPPGGMPGPGPGGPPREGFTLVEWTRGEGGERWTGR